MGCRGEVPSIEKLYQKYKDRDVVFFAVSLGTSTETERAVRQDKISYPVLLDPAGASNSRFPHEQVPTTYLIDRTGHVAVVHEGILNWFSTKVFNAIDALLNEPARRT